jgi:hypothetical protein
LVAADEIIEHASRGPRTHENLPVTGVGNLRGQLKVPRLAFLFGFHLPISQHRPAGLDARCDHIGAGILAPIGMAVVARLREG